MTTPNDAARPFLLVRESQSSDLYRYFDSREQAAEYRCLDYPDDLIEGYTATDYDALRAEVERLREEAAGSARAANYYKTVLTRLTKWLEANQPDVFIRGLWDALNAKGDEGNG